MSIDRNRLDRFFRPASIAVVGAGDRSTSSGGAVLRNLRMRSYWSNACGRTARVQAPRRGSARWPSSTVLVPPSMRTCTFTVSSSTACSTPLPRAGSSSMPRPGSTPTNAITDVQACARRRLLRGFARRGLLSDHDAQAMAQWEHGGGFSVDASVRIAAADRARRERLLRYCARPPFALDRLRERDPEHVLYESTKPGSGGTGPAHPDPAAVARSPCRPGATAAGPPPPQLRCAGADGRLPEISVATSTVSGWPVGGPRHANPYVQNRAQSGRSPCVASKTENIGRSSAKTCAVKLLAALVSLLVELGGRFGDCWSGAMAFAGKWMAICSSNGTGKTAPHP